MKRSKGMKTMTLVAAVMAAMSLTACGGEKTEGNVTQSAAEESVAAQEGGSTEAKESEQEMQSVGEVTMDTLLAHAETPAEDFEYEVYEGSAYINGYKGTDPIVVIPEEIEGCPVIEVGGLSESGIKAIKFSDSVENISDKCFMFAGYVLGEDPESLKIVVMGENVKQIGDYAFLNCKNLETVVLNNLLEEIGNGAFSMIAAKELKVPESVKEIDDSPFNMDHTQIIYVKAGSYAETWCKEWKGYFEDFVYVVE